MHVVRKISQSILFPQVFWVGLDRYIGWPIYLADTDTDTDISVSANCISVSAISVSASVSANLDIGYIGIGKISVKKH